jgi:hypothetical protein
MGTIRTKNIYSTMWGRDIDFLGPYDAFSPHSLLHGDADEWSEEEELYSWD